MKSRPSSGLSTATLSGHEQSCGMLFPAIFLVFHRYARNIGQHCWMELDCQAAGLHHRIFAHDLLGFISAARVDDKDARDIALIKERACELVFSCFCLRTNVCEMLLQQ